jgi:hypothetical protein
MESPLFRTIWLRIFSRLLDAGKGGKYHEELAQMLANALMVMRPPRERGVVPLVPLGSGATIASAMSNSCHPPAARPPSKAGSTTKQFSVNHFV